MCPSQDINEWEHWCHCNEMFIILEVGLSCETCYRTEPEKPPLQLQETMIRSKS
jgi:hypothetical protein